MRIKKITITKEDFGKTIKDILIGLDISPEVVLVKVNGVFTPISDIIIKKTEIEVLHIIKF
jgi:sulfur carrier protein ThiS